MCMFIVLISPRVQQTAQFTPLVSELILIRSHLLWEEFSAFSAANAISQFSIFFVPPGTHHCWVDRGGLVWEVLPNTSTHEATSVIWRNWLLCHVLPFVSDRPLASISRCCTVIQGQWLVPLDATRQRHHICLAEAQTAVPSLGSQVLRPLNHDCWQLLTYWSVTEASSDETAVWLTNISFQFLYIKLSCSEVTLLLLELCCGIHLSCWNEMASRTARVWAVRHSLGFFCMEICHRIKMHWSRRDT